MIRIGLIGIGTVGGGVLEVFHRQRNFFSQKLGIDVAIKRIVTRDASRFSEISRDVNGALCSTSVDDILTDPQIQIVVELIGGTTTAKTTILRALASGKHVITANKALIAEHGPEIFSAAESNGVSVFFEGAVGGGMPIIKTGRESMIGNEIISIQTIINGTCNYILTLMTEQGMSFDQALQEATAKGYAEANPTLDIEGIDAGHKISILASLFYGGYVPFAKVYKEGISSISGQDIEYAASLGYRIKLLGIIKKVPQGGDQIEVRVHPTMIHRKHILASVADEFNAVLIHGDAVGPVLLYGRGAGRMPTASAVVSDVIDVCRNILGQSPRRIPMDFYRFDNEITVAPAAAIRCRYYLRFSVIDIPGVLGSICSILGCSGISIASMVQKEGYTEDSVSVVILTHDSLEQSIQEAVRHIEKLTTVKHKTQIIRIEE
ncbi:MAG: homoserine dehydrogenase [Chitinivibrionales bacterium]|nr:homoserine dehydrogenase [Chitinivibrionales bacterium]